MSHHIGAGYGSEFHLMRYLARYRNELNGKIEKETGVTNIYWLDFKHSDEKNYDPSDPTKVVLPDQELEGLEFLLGDKQGEVLKGWNKFWPQRGTQQNWDAVAKAKIGQNEVWLLIEAKAHIKEIESSCSAKSKDSIDKIKEALNKTIEGFGIKTSNDWTQKYYQYANRLAVLYFLNKKQNVSAKLLCIYFLGDKNPDLTGDDVCPGTVEKWQNVLKKQNEYLGLTGELKKRIGISEIFLEVSPP